MLNYAVTICRPDLAVIASTLSSAKWDEITSYDRYIGLRSLPTSAGNSRTVPSSEYAIIAPSSTPIEKLLPYSATPTVTMLGIKLPFARVPDTLFSCNSLIYWSSRLQSTVALSSTAAEITSLSDLCRELVWISGMINQLGFDQSLIPVYEDNRPAIAMITGMTSARKFVTCESVTYGS